MTARVARFTDGLALGRWRWPLTAGLAGLAIGLGASLGAAGAAALTVAVGVGVAIAFRPALILSLLAASMFIEQASIGGATISRFIGVIALGLVVAEMARGRARLDIGPPLIAVTAYAIWALASNLWTVSPEHTRHEVGSLAVSIAYMLAFATLLRSRRDLESAYLGLTVAALLSGVGGMATYAITGPSRAEGLTGDPNFFAAYLVFAFPIVLALSAESRTRGVRLLCLVTLVGIVGAVFTSLSRGGIVALALVSLLILIVPARSLFRSFSQKTAAAIVIGVGVAIALVVSYSAISLRVTSLVEGREASGSGRLNEWQAAWGSSQERPMLGLGFGAFPAVSNELVKREPGADLLRFDLRATGTAVHNLYLGSLAELGLVGVVLYLTVMVTTVVGLLRGARRAAARGDPGLARLLNSAVLGLAGWGVASVFLSSETSRPVWILAGIALALPHLLPPARAAAAR